MRTPSLTRFILAALVLCQAQARAQDASPSAQPAKSDVAPQGAANKSTAGASGGGARLPAGVSGAAKPTKAKGGAAKLGNKGARPAPKSKKPRAAGPQRAPDPAARRAVAGPDMAAPSTPDPVDTPELAALHTAERELFGSDTVDAQASERAGFPSLLSTWSTGPQVYASGLPPPSTLRSPEPPVTSGTSQWLGKLALPEVPVRWSERLVRYLEFYKSDPRGRTIAATWYKKSGAYEPMLRAILRSIGVPEDLLWVAVVESGLRPTAYSSAGAAGLWQLMPDTAKAYGLVIDRWVDERLDPVRSTRAAANYLHDLHRRFGTWELALAAYNMGYGGLLASIRKYNSNDFWELSRFEAGLPWETTLYVPKVLSLMVVARNAALFGLMDVQRDPPLLFDEVEVPPGLSLSALGEAAGVALADIEQLNPQLLASRVPPRAPGRGAADTWTVRVPQGRGQRLMANLPRVRSGERRVETVTIRQGETVADVARARGTTEREIAQLNALRPDEVPEPGTVLVVPVTDKAAGQRTTDKPVVVVAADIVAPSGMRRVFYRVAVGDTLGGIAEALGVGVDDLCRWNALDPMARLHEGMTLLALVPDARDLSRVVTWADEDVRVMVAGSDEFFSYFEGLKDRVRVTMVAGPGDSWSSIARRTGLSVAMLERINRRSRKDELRPGERLVVYVPASQAARLGSTVQGQASGPSVPPMPFGAADVAPPSDGSAVQTASDRAPEVSGCSAAVSEGGSGCARERPE